MDYNKLLLLCLLLLCANVSAKLDDPTRPANYSSTIQSELVEENVTTSEVLKLSAIFISTSFKHAIINGMSVQQGDIVFSDVEILDIQETSVTVLVDGQTQELLLSSPIKRIQQGFEQ